MTGTGLHPAVPVALLKARFMSDGGTLARYEAGLTFAINQGWLALSEDGTHADFTEAGKKYWI